MTRYHFNFPPGQEPELVPELTDEEKIAAFDRFKAAFEDWKAQFDSPVGAVDIFYAGYKAGYGHAKDDDQEAMRQR